MLSREELPETAAVYLVLDGERVLYVGATKDLMQRWKVHHRLKQFKAIAVSPKIAWVEVKNLTLLPDIETALIQYFQPELNYQVIPSKLRSGPKRMTISVDDDVYEILEKWAGEEVRTVANLAAALVTLAAREKQGKAGKEK